MKRLNEALVLPSLAVAHNPGLVRQISKADPTPACPAAFRSRDDDQPVFKKGLDIDVVAKRLQCKRLNQMAEN